MTNGLMALEDCASDPVISALVAAGAALLGFLLATIRDWVRNRRDRRRRQQAALLNFFREIEGNRQSCSSNLMLLKTEKNALKAKESKGYVNALDRLEEGAWSLARLDLPTWLVVDGDLLGRIETQLSITRRVNASLESRERFHIQHLAGDDRLLVEGLTKYADVLVYPQEDLIGRIDEILRELAPHLPVG